MRRETANFVLCVPQPPDRRPDRWAKRSTAARLRYHTAVYCPKYDSHRHIEHHLHLQHMDYNCDFVCTDTRVWGLARCVGSFTFGAKYPRHHSSGYMPHPDYLVVVGNSLKRQDRRLSILAPLLYPGPQTRILIYDNSSRC